MLCVNVIFVQMFGFVDIGELIGQLIKDLFEDDDEFECFVMESGWVFVLGEVCSISWCGCCCDGSIFQVCVCGCILQMDGFGDDVIVWSVDDEFEL